MFLSITLPRYGQVLAAVTGNRAGIGYSRRTLYCLRHAAVLKFTFIDEHKLLRYRGSRCDRLLERVEPPPAKNRNRNFHG